MCCDDLHKDMATGILEAIRSGIDVKSNGECIIPNLQFT
jgi:hypothetical protein